MFSGIDFMSDTVTQPTEAMKRAMCDARLGDEQKREDPTTLALEERVAALLGKERALFFPSATMANEVAILTHCERGAELVAAENSHIFFAEAGAPSVWAGAQARTIETESGIFSGDAIRSKMRFPRGPGFPVCQLVVVENTTNMGGGRAWELHELQDVWETCRSLGLKSHLDGSRLFNAGVATGRSPAELAYGFDSVTLCLSKGLGCAAGAVLAFSNAVEPIVRRWKQCMGGSLRQSGMLAAAGLYALDHHIERLKDDHANAQVLADGLKRLESIEVENAYPSTNMVFFRTRREGLFPTQWAEACLRKGVRFSQVGENRFRAVTHLGINEEDVQKSIHILKEIENALRGLT
jgi:threonine aldolase